MAAEVLPKRLGLKYAPVPTVALEYEDVDHSLKLAVVELPDLERHAAPKDVVAKVQKQNELFRPTVVNESQLIRLLQQLIQQQREPAETLNLSMDVPKDEIEADRPDSRPNTPQKEELKDADDQMENEESKPVETEPPQEKNQSKDEEKPVQSSKEVVSEEAQVHESDFDESFEEESFIEESADKDTNKQNSFVTQPTRGVSSAGDDESETPRGKFGSGTTVRQDDDTSPSSSLPSNISTVSATDTKPAVEQAPVVKETPSIKKADESVDEIPSDDEELDYFSGGEGSGNDDDDF
ncbi:unnamed protein product [Aphanomyces euteiches]|nr:hypothetical protein AeRB84_019829 [Aphanomyces euteiches]